jgi:hypothetical protein
MAALTLPHSSALASPIEISFERMGEPQGAEDKQLRDNAQVAVAHWKSRAEYLLRANVASDDYLSVPFDVVKTIRVTYRDIGDLKPVPYPMDE